MERKHLVDSEKSDENKNKDSGIQYIKWKIQKLKQYLKDCSCQMQTLKYCVSPVSW